MANIKVYDLNPVGSELFTDSESFMTELSDVELAQQGGMTPIIVGTTIIAITLFYNP